MPREDWPPRYVNITVDMIRDDDLPQSAFRLGCKLRALAWGDPTLHMNFLKLLELTNLSRSRFYEYARALSVRTPLRWTVRSDEFECSFNEELAESRKAGRQSRNPGKRETASIKALNALDLKDGEKENLLRDEVLANPAIPENGIKKMNYEPLAVVLSEVCHMDFKANRGRLFKEAKLLSVATPTPTPELVRENYNGRLDCFWRKTDWRGKQGQNPSPPSIRETWGNWGDVAAANGVSKYDGMLAHLQELEARDGK